MTFHVLDDRKKC